MQTLHKTKIPRPHIDRFRVYPSSRVLGLSVHQFPKSLLSNTKEKLTYTDLAQNLVVTKLNSGEILTQISNLVYLCIDKVLAYCVVMTRLELMIF